MGSSLWVEAVKSKKIPPYQYATLADLSHDLGNFTKEELTEYISNAFNTFYFRPNYILGQIYRTLLRKDYSLLINGFKFFIFFNKMSEIGEKAIKRKNIT